MNKEELININGIREDLYQAMQIGDITLNSKHSQELYDFMNYQDKEIERLNNIINELDGYLDLKRKSYIEGFKWSGLEIIDQTKDFLQELKGSDE